MNFNLVNIFYYLGDGIMSDEHLKHLILSVDIFFPLDNIL